MDPDIESLRRRQGSDTVKVVALVVGKRTPDVEAAVVRIFQGREAVLPHQKAAVPPLSGSECLEDLFKSDAEGLLSFLAKSGIPASEVRTKAVGELGNGINYRLWTALRIWHGDSLLHFDRPFGRMPRIEASILAYCLCKTIRKAGITAIFTGIEDGLLPYLKADWIFVDRAGNIEALPAGIGDSPYELIMRDLEIGKGTRSDYLAVAEYHYAPVPEGIKHVYTVRSGSTIAAVSVFRSPMHELEPNVISASPVLECLDREVMNETRSVVHPHFRGLDLRMKLIKRAMSDLPGLLFETRSSLFKGTGAMEQHGRIIPRPYRRRIPAYRRLVDFCRTAGIVFPNPPTPETARRIAEADTGVDGLRPLVLARIREIDFHQWIYFATLASVLHRFHRLELRRARELFLEGLARRYAHQSTPDLLSLCKNWDSEAYVFHKPSGTPALPFQSKNHEPIFEGG